MDNFQALFRNLQFRYICLNQVKLKPMKRGLLFIWSVFAFHAVFGQSPSDTGWTREFHKARVFIENKGQFDEFSTNETGKILYGVDFGSTRITRF
jgi:hypothetical protein